ncbi:MAG: pyridoxamine 5'-phosphate oxidase family protein [Eubacteriales bacterium]|nr:pyridoxamine 5'-phosphate oxidase family protein [Eubacteriales bacterium]
MRRKDRELKDINAIFEVVKNCSVAHVAMVDEGKPYVVALNFGYERNNDELTLYFHGAYEGKKIDIFKKNPSVYFQMDCINEFIEGTLENPCDYCWRYDSVMGSGDVEFIENEAEKKHALNRIIQHLGKTEEHFDFPSQMFSKTCTYRVRSTDITGKHRE